MYMPSCRVRCSHVLLLDPSRLLGASKKKRNLALLSFGDDADEKAEGQGTGAVPRIRAAHDVLSDGR
jgi:hypothetical protein